MVARGTARGGAHLSTNHDAVRVAAVVDGHAARVLRKRIARGAHDDDDSGDDVEHALDGDHGRRRDDGHAGKPGARRGGRARRQVVGAAHDVRHHRVLRARERDFSGGERDRDRGVQG